MAAIRRLLRWGGFCCVCLAMLVLHSEAQNWRSGGLTWRSQASAQWTAAGAPAWLSAATVHWLGGGSGHNVMLAWTASSTAGVAYAVFRGPSASGPWSEIGTTPATSFTDIDAPAGTWWYTVASVADAGAGASSAYATAAQAAVP